MPWLDHAPNRLHRYFADGWYDLYDGVVVAQDAQLTVCDLVLSVTLNSQLDTRNKVWHVWRQRAEVEQILARIPVDVSLQSATLPWDDLHALFAAFCGIRYAAEAVTTKVLHKKRPQLIPIYDRVLGEFFRPQIEPRIWRQGGAPFLITYMRLFRDLLVVHEREIAELTQFVTDAGWPVTPVRVLDVLLWMEMEPSGYYRQADTTR